MKTIAIILGLAFTVLAQQPDPSPAALGAAGAAVGLFGLLAVVALIVLIVALFLAPLQLYKIRRLLEKQNEILLRHTPILATVANTLEKKHS
jgi:hypothetical protein